VCGMSSGDHLGFIRTRPARIGECPTPRLADFFHRDFILKIVRIEGIATSL
jgi:hypothetical protein